MNIRAFLTFLLLILVSTAASGDCLTPQWTEDQQAIPPISLRDRFVIGDFDEDGKPDLAATTYGTPNEAVFLRGKGNGSFEAAVTVHSGASLDDLLARDANGDGNLDLLIIDAVNDQLAFVAGNGAGTFAPAVTYGMVLGTSFIAADLTGDSKIDIATVVFDGSFAQAIVYRGNGNGTFGTGESWQIGSGPYTIAAGDLDGDGAIDLAISYFQSTRLDLLFNKGDGTFDPLMQLTVGNFAYGVTVADTDADGDNDIVTANWNDDTVTLHRNNGARQFTAVTYSATVPGGRTPASPRWIAVADITGDGLVDLVASAANGGYLAVFRSKGDGTFAAPTTYSLPRFGGTNVIVGRIATADLDLDGRIDVAAMRANWTNVSLVLNRCGDIGVNLTTETPVITTGQSATFVVSMETGFGIRPQPTGTVSIVEGDHVWATGPLVNYSASFTIAGLPLGDRTLTATYSGNAEYEPARSSDFVEHVTNERTTTTITLSPAGDPEYGQQSELIAKVTSTIGTQPTGRMMFGVDAPPVPVTYANSGPEIRRRTYDLSAGSHLIYASFLGDTIHPPSDAIPLTVVIRKVTAALTLAPSTSAETGVTSIVAYFQRPYPTSGNATGVVKFFDGNTVLGTGAVIATNGTQTAGLTLTLPLGRHDLRASYAGDANYNASQSSVVVHSVFAAGELAMDARGTADGITMAWAYRPGSGVIVFRAPALTANWTYLRGDTSHSPQVDTTAAAGNVYLYRLQLHPYGYPTPPTQVGTVDLGVRMTFTNDPTLPVTSRVLLADVQELLTQTNFLRAQAGLATVTFTDLAAGKPMRVAHITTLRTKINEARVALGAAPVTFARSLAAGTKILATDVQELREAAH
jgi:hypothetical protein